MSGDPDCLGLCGFDGEICTGCGRPVEQIEKAAAEADHRPRPDGEEDPSPTGVSSADGRR